MATLAIAKMFGSMSAEMLAAVRAGMTAEMQAEFDKAMTADKDVLDKVKNETAAETQRKLDAAALETVKTALAAVKRDMGATWDVQIKFAADGSYVATVKPTAKSILAVERAITANVGKSLGTAIVKRAMTVQVSDDGVSVIGKTSNPGTKSAGSGSTGPRATDRVLTVDGTAYTVGKDAADALGIDPGSANAWTAIFAAKNHAVLTARKVVFYGTRGALDTAIVAAVKAGALTVSETAYAAPADVKPE